MSIGGDEHPLSSELTIRTKAGDEAHIKDLPAPVMQALYHQITGKREIISQKFQKDFHITREAIKDIIERIEQTLTQFNYKGANTDITIFHHGKDKISCSSLEKFMQYDSGRSDVTSAIGIEINFLISVPQVGHYQSYKVSIDITSYVLLKEDRQASYGLRNYGNNKSPIEYSIQYVDYVVARSFKQTVDEWIESLPEVRISKIHEKFDEHVYPASRIISYIASISIIMISIYFFSIPEITDPRIYAAIFLVAMAIAEVFRHTIEIGLENVGARSFFPFIVINSGDKRNLELFLEKRGKARRFGFFIISICLLPILVNFAAILISDKFLY